MGINILTLITLILQIVVIILAFKAARKLKKEHPTLMQDYIQMKKQRVTK